MIVRLSTVRFNGPGSIDCRLCAHKTVFPDNAAVLVFRYGHRQRAISVDDLSTLHQCGREYYWQCPTCGLEVGAEHIHHILSRLQPARARGKRGARYVEMLERAMSCPVCGVPVIQRSRPSTA